MSAASSHVNTPAAAWAWLTRKLSDLDQAPGPSINREWKKFRSHLDGRDTPGTALTEWPSDFWIAKTQRSVSGIMVATWAIPERLDQWTTLEISQIPVDSLTDISREFNIPLDPIPTDPEAR